MSQPEKDVKLLKKYFGHSEFRPKQWEIISYLKEQRDVCAVMATGYGKSLCYQFPPVAESGLGIIVSPLISLMQDQVFALDMCNIPACYLGSAQTERKDLIDKILEGCYRLVYVTPEWCSSAEGFFEEIQKKMKITLVAIDEAHCISQWGFDFRSSYRYLGKLREKLRDVPFLAVTATATPQVRKDICHSLQLRNPVTICTSFDRPNLYLSVSLKGNSIISDLKPFIFQEQLINRTSGSIIIYCPTRKMANEVAQKLSESDVQCELYHAELSLKRRREVHENFVKDKVPIVVATVAFGMGIDKPDVRTVIHYGAPKDLESYYQEIGRAGRDGQPSTCKVFYNQADFARSEFFFKNLSGQFLEHKRQFLKLLECYLQTTECRRKALLSHFDPDFVQEKRDNCCDNCSRGTRTLPTLDIKDEVVKLLKAIKALGEKYGLSMAIFFLRGSESKKLPKDYYTHPLYGSGRSQSNAWWKCLGNLLVREGFLRKVDSHRGRGTARSFASYYIVLTSKGADIVNGKDTDCLNSIQPTAEMLTLSKFKLQRSNEWVSMSSGSKMKIQYEKDDEEDESFPNSRLQEEKLLQECLLSELLDLRSQFAEALDCMPYMIAGAQMLRQLSFKRPKSLEEMASIEGFTETKIRNFGSQFLDCIRTVKSGEHYNEPVVVDHIIKNLNTKNNSLSTVGWTSVEEKIRKIEQTGSDNLEKAIEHPEVNFVDEIDDDDDYFSHVDERILDNTLPMADRGATSENTGIPHVEESQCVPLQDKASPSLNIVPDVDKNQKGSKKRAIFYDTSESEESNEDSSPHKVEKISRESSSETKVDKEILKRVIHKQEQRKAVLKKRIIL